MQEVFPMKKTVFALLLAAAATLILPTAVFAGGGGDSGAKKIRIGLSLPTQREERWVRDKLGMEAEAKRLGVDLKVAIADADMAQQAQQVENLLSQGIDVLILAPHDGAAAASLVEKAKAEGVKVVAYDRLIMNSPDVALYLSFDNVKVGELQGEYITKMVPKGNYIIMSGAPTDNNATLFKQGAMKYIKPLIDNGSIKVVAEQAVDNWLPANALTIVENALTAASNNVQAILAPNDGTAGGAIQALAAQGLAGKVPITGQDAEAAAAKRIMEGTQGMTIFKDTRELAKAAINAAIAIVKGESELNKLVNNKVNNNRIDVPSYLLTPTVVTKDNLQKVLIDSGYIKKEQLM
jgi:D-xylose transport system substrate-binding protein